MGLTNNIKSPVIAREQSDRGNLMVERNKPEIAASVLKNTFLVLPRNDEILKK